MKTIDILNLLSNFATSIGANSNFNESDINQLQLNPSKVVPITKLNGNNWVVVIRISYNSLVKSEFDIFTKFNSKSNTKSFKFSEIKNNQDLLGLINQMINQ